MNSCELFHLFNSCVIYLYIIQLMSAVKNNYSFYYGNKVFNCMFHI